MTGMTELQASAAEVRVAEKEAAELRAKADIAMAEANKARVEADCRWAELVGFLRALECVCPDLLEDILAQHPELRVDACNAGVEPTKH